MKTPLLLKKLQTYGLHSKSAFMDEAFSRNIGLLTRQDQDRLAETTVAIPGLGGVGGVHLITLVRTGFGRFHISDFDTYEAANINRQFGARVPEFGRPKIEVMKEQALSINPFLEIKEFPEGINETTIDDFLDGVQVVMDGLDFFAFDTRRILFNRAREKGIYVITAGPMGFSSALLIFSPHEGMGFDEYFNVVENMADEEKHLSFGLGLAPRPTHIKYMDLSKVDLESKAGPSLNIACQIASGMAATEAVRIILKKGNIKPVPHYSQFDPFLRKYRKGKLYFGNRNPVQQIKLKAVKWILNRNKPRFKQQVPEKPTVKITSKNIPEDVIQYIIKAGIQAPSGDNCQPWKFSWNNNNIDVFLDKNTDNSFFNVNQIASIISCGAVIENMTVASTNFGLRADAAHCPDSQNKDHMATVTLKPDQTEKSRLTDFIWQRHTNRKFYKKIPVPGEVLKNLQNETSVFDGVQLHFVTEKSDLKKLAKLVYKVDRIRTEHRPLHEHLYKMIRFTEKETLENRDGFPLKNLEAGIAGEMFLKLTRPWPVMSFVNRIGLGRMVALHSLQGIINSSCAGLLTVTGISAEDFLKGGRALQHLWLIITRIGMYFQPMTAITLFWMRWLLEGKQNFSKKHQELLSNVWKDYPDLFPDVEFKTHGHVMLFRLGFTKEIRYGTLRKDIDTFL